MVNNKKWFRPMFERTAQRTATMIALLERSRYGECLYCKNPDQIRMKISGIGQKPIYSAAERAKRAERQTTNKGRSYLARGSCTFGGVFRNCE